MNSLIAAISGKKTYIVAAAAVLYALVQYWAGAIDGNQCTELVLAAAGLGGLRAGVTKSGPTSKGT